MATLSGLVNTIAVVQGLDENQVLWIARYLREAGLITQGGRGRGGAKMTVSDAANLLIGVNGPGAPKDAATTVRIFRDLDLTRDDLADPDLELWDASAEEPFKRGSPFGPALEYLIEIFVERPAYASADDITRVTLAGPLFNAHIFQGLDDFERASDISLAVHFGRDNVPGKNYPDQHISKSFTERTLAAVAKTIAT